MIEDFRLKVFVVVSQTLNFTRASEQLNITQPAVTKHIKELEKQISAPLFIRYGSKINLTDKGEKLLQYAKQILTLYKELNQELQDNTSGFEGVFNLGASTTASQYLIPEILAQFKKEYPNIKVVLSSGNSMDIAKGVINGSLDFAIVEGNETNPTLHYENFLKDEIVLVCSTKNCEKFKDKILIDQIKTIPLLIREEGSGTLSVIDSFLLENKLSRQELNIQMQLGSSESIKSYLLHSDSFAFISLVAVSDYLKEDKLRIVELENFEISRFFRFVSLHGNSNKMASVFKQFCNFGYKRKL